MFGEPSPGFYHALLEDSPLATLVFGADQRCRWVSPGLSRLTGRPSKDYLDQGIDALVCDSHPEDRGPAQEAWTTFWTHRAGRAQPGGVPLPPVTFLLRMRLKSGEFRLVELTGLNRLEDPAIQGLVLHFSLLVDRKRAEDLLLSERERLLVTLRSIGEGVIATDVEDRVTLINAVTEGLTGWTQAEAVGRPLSEVFPIDQSHPTTLISRTGRASVIEASAAPIHNSAGGLLGSVLVFRDVTESRRTADELLKRQKLESIGVLAGGIAHDFNNILSAILGTASLGALLVEPSHPVAELLAGIQQASRRASALTQRLLTFSQGGAPVLESIQVPEVIRQDTEFLLHGTACQAVFDLASDLDPVLADPGQLGQVIQNLVLNASQAMKHGGLIVIRATNVTLVASTLPPLPDGKYVRLEFADEGAGIPAGHLGKIFEPYYTTKPTGSGLGLAVVWSIVKGHGGWVQVESKVGEGTTFTLWLPATTAIPPVPETHSDSLVRHGLSLVMDDEAEPRRTMAVMLRHLGFDCLEASSGEAALVLLEQYPSVALALVDLTVKGGMGGREVLPQMKKLVPSMKVIVTSGYSIDPVMADHRGFGFDGALKKPFGLADLTMAVDATLGG